MTAAGDTDAILVGPGSTGPGDRRLGACLVREAGCSVWLVPERAPTPPRRILIPVDFSVRAADSLRVATALARLSGTAECLALHVAFNDSLSASPESSARLRREIEGRYDRFLAGVDCLGVRVTPLFQEGANVARTILRTAEEQEADLIVMASRGRTRVGAIFLESVAEQTLHATPVPLLVVKHFGARLGAWRAFRDPAFRRKNDMRFN
jgi:nucleotide-binding universal stress UspA family protein